MSERRCCSNCFGDSQIRKHYIDLCDPIRKTCDYCGSVDVKTVVPRNLSQWFDPLMSTYEIIDQGSPIIKLLREDWDMFRDSGLSDSEAKELLTEILDDAELMRKSFSPMTYPAEENLQRWEELRDEMKHKNRWFLENPMDMTRIQELFTHLIVESGSLSRIWYRARMMRKETPLTLTKMGAPPSHLASHGRANPAGIPYLYLGSTPNTAVAEIRPHTGEKVYVAKFPLPELKFVDLRDPRNLVSPLHGDEEETKRLRSDLPLLERLGEELMRPVQSHSAPYEYVPTQYLCEYMKECGFDGVVYRSSASSDEGINVALFDPHSAQPASLDTVTVAQVSVQIAD